MNSQQDDWWSAHELMQSTQVWGKFYETEIAGCPEKLRSHLEIFPNTWEPSQAIDSPPDLLVVMMNPGSSEPLTSLESYQGFVPTRPDNTQYQIMRLLRRTCGIGLDWQHARILNLSDLRTPKSATLFEKLAKYATDDQHSIFSTRRQSELARSAPDTNIPVLFGWGLNRALNALARRAITALPNRRVLGVSADSLAYRHPLPQRFDFQRQWLDQLTRQISISP